LPGLGNFLEDYRSEYSDDFVQIEDPITVDYETTAYYKIFEARNPVLWFKKINGYPDFTIASNILGNRRRMASALGSRPSDFFKKWREITSHAGQISVSDHKADVKQVVATDDRINLFDLPVCKHFLQDGSSLGFPKYVTSGLAVARNPLSPSTVNLSYARMQLISRNEYAFDLGSKGHFESYVEHCKQSGKTLPVSIIIGAHPLYYMLAAASIENEYAKASKILDNEYTSGVSNDIPVPSDAEIVLEAEIDPVRFVEEGPFSEFTGYVSKGTTGQVGRVQAVSRKRKAIFYDIIPSNSNEHVNLFSMPRDSAASQSFEELMPKTSSYELEWPIAGSHLLAFCGVSPTLPGLAKQAGLAVLALDPLFTKIALVTEGKTDLSLSTFLMNLALDLLEDRKDCVSILENLFCITLDPTAAQRGVSAKVILIAKDRNLSYAKTVEEDEVRLEADSVRVVISHQASEGQVNLVVGDDIDLANERELIWAMATRVRPDEDILLENKKMRITATRKFAEVPKLPPDLLEEIRRRVNI
jgi:2,5-furandicarboxylate decarboxylase 1